MTTTDQILKRATYSRNVFIPVTDLCSNRCGYCTFRRDLDQYSVISRDSAQELMDAGVRSGATEALFSMGERPWVVPGSPGRAELMDHLVELCEMAIESGLLPHTNAGVLQADDLKCLAPFNASMGLMLETTASIDAHRLSPQKSPEVRLEYMALAGKLRIPFTTGILVGIGESRSDRLDALRAISQIHETYGHIQEVIVQPFDPKPGTPMASTRAPAHEDVLDAVIQARAILPDDVAIQVPPNLLDALPFLEAGANDLGGISSVTPDWINPGRAWPGLEDLGRKFDLRERLPVYPGYVLKGWYGRYTSGLVSALAGADGLRRFG
ncbi:MAG TPA: 7,8-didemethyl-8-hydroxy-5-deazariboflavin synthase subunit CofG [Methanotrichaceae archaeon]|nr:7,8-didemethyl-8-hydroxy-5-deazariboflavin synthase subunit CofG [Methanotrichaceae archaeon]